MDKSAFVYFLENISKPSHPAIERHVAYLRALDERGALVFCGPFKDGNGGMVCFEAESEEAALVVAQGDPFVTEGFKRYRLREVERGTRENNYLLG